MEKIYKGLEEKLGQGLEKSGKILKKRISMVLTLFKSQQGLMLLKVSVKNCCQGVIFG